MIRVERAEIPAILKRKARIWLEELRAAKSRAERERIQNRYRRSDIKKKLMEMFNNKCAYCESKITHVDYGHIEHYRPKSRWPEFTFSWDNLFLACGICNGPEHKGDRFPEASAGGPIVNPCEDEPSDHLEFRFDPVTTIASVYGKTSRGEVTEKLLGLNRPDLRIHRSKFLKKLSVLALFAPQSNEAAELLIQAVACEEEYSAFARGMTLVD
jgi:uncharacterized protein (TIGR02646 family)